MNLIGEYPVSIDDKCRFRVPTALLRQLPAPPGSEEGYAFVVNRGFESCLTLYPRPVWDELTARINQLNRFNEKHRQFIRTFYFGAYPVSTDTAGRLLLQKPLMDYAGINDEALLLAINDRIEIWSPTLYNQQGMIPGDFSELAESVLGGGFDVV